ETLAARVVSEVVDEARIYLEVVDAQVMKASYLGEAPAEELNADMAEQWIDAVDQHTERAEVAPRGQCVHSQPQALPRRSGAVGQQLNQFVEEAVCCQRVPMQVDGNAGQGGIA